MATQTALPESDHLSPSTTHPLRDISSGYEIPNPQPFTSFGALKDRIRHHYEICSEYYYSLW
jgi:tocopherol O-methyltransferase